MQRLRSPLVSGRLVSRSRRLQSLLHDTFHVQDVDSFLVCSPCLTSLNGNRVPHLSRSHGFYYPDIPSHLEPLNQISERMVSSRAARKGPEVRSTPFDYATSEGRRRDRLGVVPSHVLYMAAKVMHLHISQRLSVTFHNMANAGA